MEPIADLIATLIISREGDRFTDDPLDRGGATKYGITQKTWDAYLASRRDNVLRPANVESIEERTARDFYKTQIIEPLLWIEDAELLDLVADCAVLHGATRATMWLQRAAGVLADGVIGPETRAAVNASKFHSELVQRRVNAIYASLLITRIGFIVGLVTREPSQLKFLAGWINRCVGFIR